MRIHFVILLSLLMIAGIGGNNMFQQSNRVSGEHAGLENEIIKLPVPKYDGLTSIEKALSIRRSVRKYNTDPLTLAEVSQLLWAAQGITDRSKNFRTAPSAGALYPLELYVVIGRVREIKQGVYKYKPHEHELVKVRDGNMQEELSTAALRQNSVSESAIVLVFTAVFERTTKKYADRGIKYIHMEIGHAAQNVYLQAVSLNLGTVAIGAFRDEEVKKILNMPAEEHPLYILPVGKL
ncbi:MAG: SagB/ThcOx family dehydrogenase [Bacteroidales bacterium]|nr:SagB/ThcOx family dehydrogenase [Bacteroidales bacterium]MDZ4204797.1 SagB/ThcOx family dehydrogenase [Bacteroidales bacterium]